MTFEAAVLQRFGQVRRCDISRGIEICNGPGNLEYPVVGTRRQLETFHRLTQQ